MACSPMHAPSAVDRMLGLMRALVRQGGRFDALHIHSTQNMVATHVAAAAAAAPQVLTQEGRKRVKLMRQAPASSGQSMNASAAAASPTAPQAAEGQLDANLRTKLRHSGAHVVAPCPHDGTCPLAGTRAWCHFSVRAPPTGWMQQLGLSGRAGAEQETYSYVVLR